MARAATPSPPIDAAVVGPASPPPPANKRDKKRQMLTEKLAEMVSSFSSSRDQHYRAQLQALQMDMSLVLLCEPYANVPLEDSGSDVDTLIANATGGSAPPDDAFGSDYKALVGRYYRQFADSVNDELEYRDNRLTELWNIYQTEMEELRQLHRYRVKIATEEHRHLATTVRERLLQATASKKAKLMREKEMLDVADSNSQLLNPSQLSLNYPSSPGGPQHNRKTRHTRHRVGDPDDVSGTNTAQEGGKRKRKAIFDEESESKGPAGRFPELAPSPFRVQKARMLNGQYEAPVYSIDRLFSEKELAMIVNTASVAATQFLNRLKAGSNGDSGLGDGPDDTIDGAIPAADIDSDAGLAAPEMERSVSQTYHATRGATKSGLADLATAATAESTSSYGFSNALPYILPMNMNSRANQNVPPPPPASSDNIESDLKLMSRNPQAGDSLTSKLIDQALRPLVTSVYEYRSSSHLDDATASSHPLQRQPSSQQYARPAVDAAHLDAVGSIENLQGGVPMSAQSSMGASGVGDYAGGVTMSRTGNGSSIGGIGMRRTASGRGDAGLLGAVAENSSGGTPSRRGRPRNPVAG